MKKLTTILLTLCLCMTMAACHQHRTGRYNPDNHYNGSYHHHSGHHHGGPHHRPHHHR